jgi:hypothetical protein
MAEREEASGTDFIRAVTLGYDICCRVLEAMDSTLLYGVHYLNVKKYCFKINKI